MYIYKKYFGYLSVDARFAFDELVGYGIDPDLALELVEMEFGEDAYELG